jgi:Fic family protein
MKALSSEFEKKDIDILRQSTIIHAKFEKIHPFSD